MGRTGRVSRFATSAAYATYNGAAPVKVVSAEHQCHRLNRYGDRRLNPAIPTIAVVRVRMPNSAGLRSLKRHLSNQFWRTMLADEHHHCSVSVSCLLASTDLPEAISLSLHVFPTKSLWFNAFGQRIALSSDMRWGWPRFT